MKQKRCSKCKSVKAISDFYNNKNFKDGKFSWCKDCFREHYRKWKAENHDKVKKWERENIEKMKKCRKKWARKNLAHFRNRRKNDSTYRLNKNISWAVNAALRGKKAGRKWQRLVGYTTKDLIKHLEAQFDSKMSWNNYGSYWEVDHRKPKAAFNYVSPRDLEFKECWALSNLQPMEAKENHLKGARFVEAIAS